MRRLPTTLTSLAAVTAVSLIATSAATAATEIGDNCTGDDTDAPMSTLVALSSPSNPLPVSAPHEGVITKWRVTVVPYPGGISERLQVLRPTGAPNTFTVAGQSDIEPVAGGTNLYLTRIPVQLGDRLGVLGSQPAPAIYCGTASTAADTAGYFEGALGIGGTGTFTETAKVRPAVSAVIEPDADRDGFGDETQDLCPQSAAFQVACPLVTLDAVGIAGRRSVTVYVAASHEAPVTVSGVANIGKGARAILKAAPKVVPDGKIVRFTLRFPASLQARLKSLKPKQKLALTITASASNVAGAASTDRLNAKLKGQAK